VPALRQTQRVVLFLWITPQGCCIKKAIVRYTLHAGRGSGAFLKSEVN